LNEECIVVGDLHGNFSELVTIIKKWIFPANDAILCSIAIGFIGLACK